MMRVYIDTTPNPNILKFVCDETLTTGALELGKDDPATDSLLAQEILQFPFVSKVYITANFVAVQKTDAVEWEMVADELKQIVNQHLIDGTILMSAQEEDPFTLYVEMTPNPAVMKFVTNKLLYNGIAESKNAEDTAHFPLAKALYQFDYVKEVFVSENYISITKIETADWNELALELRYFLLEYLQKGDEIVGSEYVPLQNPFEKEFIKKEYTDVEMQIKDIITEYIQPAVAGDGGNIQLIEFEEDTKTARMLLQGACSGCPSSTITLKNGIESMLKQMMPGKVENVEAVNG
ncbi:NifU family protein [Moheibacter lacus]|uniref:NifU family protein n=1 Tax=Moheibacter lacus TaxID=2745851 RepID=A0A838ZSJ1_9FLAO|nr:NifU family protein [Moheibacter lacus]MBA5629941.1 NifU family protein [Moheibacter lacus]